MLEDLELRRPAALPQLERLRVARVEVHGRLFDIVDGRIERLRLDEVDAVLSPDPRPPRLDHPALRVGLLELTGGGIAVRAGEETASFELLASLRDLGGAVSGEVRVSGPRLDTTALELFVGGSDRSAIGAEAVEPTATLHLERDGALALDLAADQVTLRWRERRLPLGSARLHATGALAGDRILLTGEPQLEALGPSRVELTLARDPLRLEHLDARFARARPGTVVGASWARSRTASPPTGGSRSRGRGPRIRASTPGSRPSGPSSGHRSGRRPFAARWRATCA